MAKWFFGLIFWTGLAFAGEMEARRDGVEVYADTSKKIILGTLKKGENIAASERKGMYWQVTFSGKPGYVSVMGVQTSSSARTSLITESIMDAVKQGRKADDPSNNRARSTVMGVRGLDDTSESAFAGNVKPNLRMVYGMEDLVVSRSDLKSLEDSIQAEIEQLSAKRN